MRVMRCTLRFAPSRNPIDPTPPIRRHYRRSHAAAHRNEQLRLLPIQSHRLNSPDVGAGQTLLVAFAALEPPRVGAGQEVNSLLRRHQLPQYANAIEDSAVN